MRSRRIQVLILTFTLALASGCATRIGVRKESAAEGNSFRTQSALTNGRPSQTSAQFLYRLDLAELAQEDPKAALMHCMQGLARWPSPLD